LVFFITSLHQSVPQTIPVALTNKTSPASIKKKKWV
jgi:hypothetical protein